MKVMMNSLSYTTKFLKLKTQEVKKVHIIEYEQGKNPDLTLLISKVSEAINPNIENNHIGEGDNMDSYLEKQQGVRFIINAGFSHYRKNFYDWKHQDFNVGDPVGLVKIRQHIFEDYLDLTHYGFFVQKEKKHPWQIVDGSQLDKSFKYILGCTPLLINYGQNTVLPMEQMIPVEYGKINPPSYLGHGLENHPRTAIGANGERVYFIIVDGDNDSGCTLIQLQEIGMQLGLDKMLNLDGGGSSQFRMMVKDEIIKNNTTDSERILGHVLVIFDETLRKN
jgi:hypothetical protein